MDDNRIRSSDHVVHCPKWVLQSAALSLASANRQRRSALGGSSEPGWLYRNRS